MTRTRQDPAPRPSPLAPAFALARPTNDNGMTSHNSHYSRIPMSESPFYDLDQGTVGADIADLLANISHAKSSASLIFFSFHLSKATVM